MPDTECGFDQKHIFLFTLDRAARMLLEGVGDLNERELREVEEPLSAPSHTVRSEEHIHTFVVDFVKRPRILIPEYSRDLNEGGMRCSFRSP